ncbi:DUF1702 family protein [Streptomyces sp. NPDC047002]|uniref:DUF1702 family protein n=1 Tax=Streptomyces sp. NPDC047002 TaxID=3155475 RepID=UPI003455907D
MTATLMGSLRKLLVTPATREITFETRGFEALNAGARAKLEHSALQFLVGFEFAVEHREQTEIVTRLGALEREYQGFAYEGAAMALALRDALSPVPGARLTEIFLKGPGYDDGPGSRHVFMAYLGVGFAIARLPRPLWHRALPDARRLADHPALSWLVVDGYGFHQAFFHHAKWVDSHYVPRGYPWWPGDPAYTQRVVDQGIGRGMWFVCGGDVERLLARIAGFDPARHSDLLCGAGLAATYAGAVDADQLEALRRGAGPYAAEIAQGAVFALRARQVAGLITDHNEIAAQIFCGMTAEESAQIAAKSVIDLPPDGAVPAYEVFRRRIQQHFR